MRYIIYLDTIIGTSADVMPVVARASFRATNEAPPEWVTSETKVQEVEAADEAAMKRIFEAVAAAQYQTAKRMIRAPEV